MTNIGTARCMACGRTSQEQVFYWGSQNLSLKLFRDWRGRYGVLAAGSDGKLLRGRLTEKPEVDRDSGTILKLKGTLTLPELPPQSFTLRARHRICPDCLREGRIRPLPPYAGMAPAYLIGVTGLPGAGKSVLLNAAFTGNNVSILRKALHGASLETGVSDEETQIDSTQLAADALGLLKTVRILDRSGQLTAVLHFKDSPGELFDPEKYGAPAWEQHFETFSHCDGLLYVTDPREIQAQGISRRCELGDPNHFLQELPKNIPTAVVLTKADQLQPLLPLYSQSGELLLNRASPVFRPAKAIPQRMLLDRALLLNLLPSLAVSPLPANPCCGCFTVSSGEERADHSFDYSLGCNVHLPFLFLLNALGLGSFLEQEETI